MQAVNNVVAGILIALALAAASGSGLFDEAAQYQESKSAWCAASCK